jgi:hypothetical protein
MTTSLHRDTRALLRRSGYLLAIAAALAVLLSVGASAAGKAKKASGETKQAEGASEPDAAPAAKPDTVRIIIQTVPPRRARVKWGRKSLGVIPTPSALVVVRPRDSGPLDLVIRATGFLPVHTRAYTFTDSRVAVKLTPLSDKSKLFGYREEPAPSPDGGVPAEPAPTP